MNNKTALIIGGIIIFIILLAIIGSGGSNNNYNSQGINSNNGWHTIKIIDDVNGSYTKDFEPEYIKITGKKIRIDYNCTTYNPSGPTDMMGLFNGDVSDPDGNFSVSFPGGTDSCADNKSFEIDIPAPGIYKLWYHYGFAKVKLMISEYDYCNSDELTCDKYIKKKFYYINSENRCVLAPHNPYPSSEYCKKDVGQFCYIGNTCGGAGSPGSITIKGVSYKLVTAKELKQNALNAGFANNNDSDNASSTPSSMVAIKGIISAVTMGKNKTHYDLIVDTIDGSVVVSVETIDPDTEVSNGFYARNFPVGTKVIAGGVFIKFDEGVSIKDFFDANAQLKNINPPIDTPILFSNGTLIKLAQ